MTFAIGTSVTDSSDPAGTVGVIYARGSQSGNWLVQGLKFVEYAEDFLLLADGPRIRCGESDPEYPHFHGSVQAVKDCYHDIAQARAEIEAENAWLRAAEAGTPDTWAEEERERQIEALGYGPPPGF